MMKVVDAKTIGSLVDFWNAVADRGFWKDSIDVNFDCKDVECLYGFMCTKSSSSERRIGKWCPYYCEKLVEFLQKEKSNENE